MPDRIVSSGSDRYIPSNSGQSYSSHGAAGSFERRLLEKGVKKSWLNSFFQWMDSNSLNGKTDNGQTLWKYWAMFVALSPALFGSSYTEADAVSDAQSAGVDTSDWSKVAEAGIVGAEATDLVSDSSKSKSDSDSGSWWSNLLKSIVGSDSSFSGNLLSVLGGIGSEFANSLFNMNNMKELIDYQNAYNTPKAQMARFEEAGLNPNLIYGLGSSGNQPSSGSIAPVDFDTSQRENRLAQFQMDLQTKDVMSQIGERQALVDLYKTQEEGASEDVIAKRMQNDVFMEQYQASLKVTIQQYDNLIAEKEQILQHTRESEARTKTENELRDLKKSREQAEINLVKFNSHSKYGQIAEDFGSNIFKQLGGSQEVYRDLAKSNLNKIQSTFDSFSSRARSNLSKLKFW